MSNPHDFARLTTKFRLLGSDMFVKSIYFRKISKQNKNLNNNKNLNKKDDSSIDPKPLICDFAFKSLREDKVTIGQ
jgi:hypothetical protein